MMVGIIKEKATFLYTGSRDPKAGLVMYWLPVYAYTVPPTMLKTMISRMVQAHSALGKSRGSFISAMKLGSVI